MTSKRYTPRPWQPAMTRHMVKHQRCNIFAGMGSGKSAATLEALATLFAFGLVQRVLIIGPKRVARDTWPEAISNFADSFGWMSIAVAIGTDKQRRAAVAAGAMITTINFDNLDWLVTNYGASWPWDMVVVDESTKLRGLRVSIQTHKQSGKKFLSGQGGSRAKALARVAHTRVQRWVNLTGTPTLAGLEALWGPTWFLDAGHRLGNSFTAFSHRWFRAVPGSSPQQQVIEPMPGAEAQIKNAIQDITLVVDIKDYVDVGQPVENVIRVELPAEAQRQYDEMASELATEIDGQVIEAFSAGTKSQKCLAEGTQVLSARGWVAIESVTATDVLWDGVEWVRSAGSVCNGVRAVVNCWGVDMTPDHLVMAKRGWTQASEVLHRGLQDKEFSRREVRLPDDNGSRRISVIGWKMESQVGCGVHLRQGDYGHRVEPQTPNSQQTEVMRLSQRGTTCRRPGHPWSQSQPTNSAVGRCYPEMHESEVKGLVKLRGARNLRVRPVVIGVRELLERHARLVSARAAARPKGQQRTIQPRELQVGHCGTASEQQEDQCSYRDTVGPDHSRRGSRPSGAEKNNGIQATRQRLAGESTATARVYDIVNCGPRHRFTVRGSDGQVFLAHNCLQIASGAMYTDDQGNFVTVHDEKLEALKSIQEEALGMPLLVFYHFKSDKARILKAFPKARELDDNPKTMRDFRDGKIPMLLAHPASAGHGVDGLQHGTSQCVFFSTNWSAENDAQAIERIGPTRQMQSGYDRVVTVHRIVAKGTVEESAVARLKSRVSVQEALLESLKKYQKTACA